MPCHFDISLRSRPLRRRRDSTNSPAAGFCSGWASRTYLWWRVYGSFSMASRSPPCARYLRAMAEAPYQSVPPAALPKIVLAALGPKMLELSAESADGALSYNVTPEHPPQGRPSL